MTPTDNSDPQASGRDPASDGERDGERQKTLRTARDAALNLLSVRARSVSEMEDRLQRKDFAPDVVAETVEWLLERSLLDDEEFARLFLEDRIRSRPRGSFALVRELVKRGVARATAERVLEEVFAAEGVDELDLARDSARTWIRKQPRRVGELLGRGRPDGSDAREEWTRQRRRLYGHLVRKGYSREVVGMAVDEAVRDGLPGERQESV